MSGNYPLYIAAAYPAAGGNITVEEVDGNPSHNVHTLIFPNGSVSIQGTRATITLAGSGDMVLASAQKVSGAKTFLDSTLLLRNVANTFSAQFSNTNTAARTYTLPNVSGTVALTSDLSQYLEIDTANAYFQPINSGLTAISALTTTSFGRSLLTQVDAAATRTTIGAGTSSFDGAYSSLSGIPSTFAPTVHNQAWSTITSTPTTLSGYGITDAANAIHYHAGTDITSGTVDPARLGSGTSITTKFLRGDSTWQTISGGGDALVASNLDQFADVTQTAGQTLAITSSTTLSGGTHSGTNTGDNATNSQYSGLVSNATHTGDVTGATALTIKTDVALAGNPTTTTQTATDNSTRIATTAFVKTAIPAQFQIAIDTTTTGFKAPFYRVPYNCTITGWELVSGNGVSGSVVLDLWKDTYPNYEPTDGDSITGSALPTLTASNKAQSTTLTGWTTTLSEGDYIGANVDSRTTVTSVVLTLILTRS